jgi:hypothetical protein
MRKIVETPIIMQNWKIVLLLVADHSDRAVSYELSSLPSSLGSLVRIPLKAWMSVCVYSMFVLLCA